MGRTCPLSRNLIKAVEVDVLEGASPMAAACKFGYARSTVRHWLQIGRETVHELLQEGGEEGEQRYLSYLEDLRGTPEMELTYEQKCVTFWLAVESKAESTAEIDAAKRAYQQQPMQWLQASSRRPDWWKHSRTQVEMHGQIEHSGGVSIEEIMPNRVLGETLALMEQAGLIQASAKLAGFLTHAGNGEGEVLEEP